MPPNDKLLAITTNSTESHRMDLDTLRDLYLREIAELHCFEDAQCLHLPALLKATQDRELCQALEEHLTATKKHAEALASLAKRTDDASCSAAEELMKECVRLAEDEEAEPEVRDAAMLAAVQQLEHLEIAKYGAARSHAEDLGEFKAADVLAEIVEEEGLFDRQLTRLAERSINFKAADN